MPKSREHILAKYKLKSDSYEISYAQTKILYSGERVHLSKN